MFLANNVRSSRYDFRFGVNSYTSYLSSWDRESRQSVVQGDSWCVISGNWWKFFTGMFFLKGSCRLATNKGLVNTCSLDHSPRTSWGDIFAECFFERLNSVKLLNKQHFTGPPKMSDVSWNNNVASMYFVVIGFNYISSVVSGFTKRSHLLEQS